MSGAIAIPATGKKAMRDRIRRVCLLLLIVCLTLPAAAEDSPSAIVERLNETLLEVMRDADALGFAGRYERLEPVLTRVFAFQTMARIATGGHWQSLTAEQRRRLADAFARFSIATFASRFDGYSGERFEIAGEEQTARGSVLVRNRLVADNGETVPIDYLLRHVSGESRIVDIYLDGAVSELATRRSEYISVLDNGGFGELMARLEGRIADLGG